MMGMKTVKQLRDMAAEIATSEEEYERDEVMRLLLKAADDIQTYATIVFLISAGVDALKKDEPTA